MGKADEESENVTDEVEDLERELQQADVVGSETLIERYRRLDELAVELERSRWAAFSDDELAMIHAGLSVGKESAEIALRAEVELELSRRAS